MHISTYPTRKGKVNNMTQREKRMVKRYIIKKAKQIALGFATVVVFGATFVMAARCDYQAEFHYGRKAKVVSINSYTESVTVVDEDGEIWTFYGDGYKLGEKITIEMDSKGTKDITDDVVVDVRK